MIFNDLHPFRIKLLKTVCLHFLMIVSGRISISLRCEVSRPPISYSFVLILHKVGIIGYHIIAPQKKNAVQLQIRSVYTKNIIRGIIRCHGLLHCCRRFSGGRYNDEGQILVVLLWHSVFEFKMFTKSSIDISLIYLKSERLCI